MSALGSLGALAAVVVLGCVSGTGPRPADFSTERSFGGALELAASNARSPGSPPLPGAREAVVAALQGSGVRDIRELRPLTPDARGSASRHLLGVLPGRSSDLLVLLAGLDSVVGEAPKAQAAVTRVSGAALLLELARVFGGSDRPYTIWFVFLDNAATGDAPGAESFAAFLGESGRRERVRAVFHFADVAGPKVRIGRDLRSHGIYREVFFDAAIPLGPSEQFPRGADLALPDGPHRALLERGMGQVVAIVNVAEPPDEAAGSPASEATARANLEAVGQVSIVAIDRIARDLERADRLGGGWRASENPPAGVAVGRRR